MLGNAAVTLKSPGQGVPTCRAPADGRGMPSRSVVPTLLTFAAGAAVAVVARRLARRRSASAVAAVSAPRAAAEVAPVAAPSRELEAVVLPFSRPAAPAPTQPAAPAGPARCGENGGRTKAGAPCAARATSGGRCHHHRLAA